MNIEQEFIFILQALNDAIDMIENDEKDYFSNKTATAFSGSSSSFSEKLYLLFRKAVAPF